MPAGTAVTPIERPIGNQFHGKFTLAPGLIATIGAEAETVAIPGLQVGDIVFVQPQYALGNGILVGPVVVTANQIAFNIENQTAGGVTPPTGAWNYAVFRGSTDRLGL